VSVEHAAVGKGSDWRGTSSRTKTSMRTCANQSIRNLETSRLECAYHELFAGNDVVAPTGDIALP
jgi:hypothetical protein